MHCMRVLFFLTLAPFLTACVSETESPEEQIRQLIVASVESAEARELSALKKTIHPNYLDQRGHRKDQLLLLMRGLFLRHKNVHLFTKIRDIELQSNTEARVQMYVAMAASPITNAASLTDMRARLYEFELHLVNDENWRVSSAAWRSAGLTEVE